MRRRIVWASTIYNGLEWFDFVVFGLLAMIIAKNLFPHGRFDCLQFCCHGIRGIAPLATEYAIKVTGSDMAPFYYLASCLSLSVVGVTLLAPRDRSERESAAVAAEDRWGDRPSVLQPRSRS